MDYLFIFIAGFSGGMVRGLVGFIKHHLSKSVKFEISHFLLTALLSGIVGALSALVTKELGFTFLGDFTPALGFIIGYAGGDFIENIYKIIIKKSSLYSLPEDLKKK